MMNRNISLGLACLIVGAAGFIAMLGLQVARWAEQTFYQVNVDWQVARVDVVGADLVVYSTVVKNRGCDYKPPPIGFAETGEPIPVKSLSATAGANWPPGPERRPVGPWVLVGGAEKTVEIHQEHWCHAMWPVMSKLGTVNAEGQIK
jgi:hypothetical protein